MACADRSSGVFVLSVGCLSAANVAGLVVGIAGNQPAGVVAQLQDLGFEADLLASSAEWAPRDTQAGRRRRCCAGSSRRYRRGPRCYSTLGEGYTLVRREYMTAIGPVDLLCRDADGGSVAVEVKRRGEIEGVEQLTRYLELMNRDPLLAPVTGVFAAQQIKPQARTLAEDRGIRCVAVDYDALRGVEKDVLRLF
jgi:hypothetical protein